MNESEHPLYIFAGTKRQAVDWANYHNIHDWRYVGRAEYLRGLRGGDFVIVGTFTERRDSQEIMKLARLNDFEMIEVTER